MKKTTVQYFCDKCGEEIAESPSSVHKTGEYRDCLGTFLEQYRVTIEYSKYMGVEFEQSMLCNKCKIEALEEVLNGLKEQNERR